MFLFSRGRSVLASSIGFDMSGQRSPYGLDNGVGMNSRDGTRVSECVVEAAIYNDGRGSVLYDYGGNLLTFRGAQARRGVSKDDDKRGLRAGMVVRWWW